jgi:hypothetical protein
MVQQQLCASCSYAYECRFIDISAIYLLDMELMHNT